MMEFIRMLIFIKIVIIEKKISNINEATRGYFNPFYFFEEILHTNKHKMQTSNFHSDIFKRLKSIKIKQATFTHKKHKMQT